MLGLIFFPGFIRIVSRVNDQSEGPQTDHNLKTLVISNSLVPLWDGEIVKYQLNLITRIGHRIGFASIRSDPIYSYSDRIWI